MSIAINEYTSRKISRLGMVCALLVVLLHCTFGNVLRPEGFFGWTQAFVNCGVTRVAVPFFFVISGFLLLKDFSPSWEWYTRKLKSRAQTLVLPYFIWGMIGLLNIFAFNELRRNATALDWGGFSFWLKALGIVTPPTGLFVLWFVRILIISVLISPFIGILLRRIGFWLVVVLFIAGICLDGCFIHFAYVAGGGYVAIGGVAVDKLKHKSTVPLALILWGGLIICKTLIEVHDGRSASVFRLIAICMNMFGIYSMWFLYDVVADGCLWHLLDPVIHSGFLLYVMHVPVSLYWQYPALHSTWAARFPFAYVCYSYIGMVFFPLLFCFLLKKSNSRFLQIAFAGGRI